MVRPGTGSHSPACQSRTSRAGGQLVGRVVQQRRGDQVLAHAEVRGRPAAENDLGDGRKASKSVRVCHGGVIAGLKACTNGCMSVVDRSCFSYQVAAGSTTSENSAWRSSGSPASAAGRACPRAPRRARRRPSGALRRRSSARGPRRRCPAGAAGSTRCPCRGAEQVRPPHGQHPRAVLRRRPGPRRRTRAARLQLVDDVRAGRPGPAAAASSARSSGLRSKVGYEGIQPSRADWASSRRWPARRTCPGPAGRRARRR